MLIRFKSFFKYISVLQHGGYTKFREQNRADHHKAQAYNYGPIGFNTLISKTSDTINKI